LCEYGSAEILEGTRLDLALEKTKRKGKPLSEGMRRGQKEEISSGPLAKKEKFNL